MLQLCSRAFRLGIVLASGVVSVSWPSLAQTSAWLAPASGYVYDGDHKDIRPIAGFIGSAFLGAPVLEGVDAASIAPNQTYALVQRGGALIWVPNLNSPDNTQVLERVPSANGVLWASDSSRAVILGTSRLIWLGGLNSTPVEDAGWRLDDLPGMLVHAAIHCRDHSSGPAGQNNDCSSTSSGPRTWSLLATDSQAERVLLVSRSAAVSQLWLASRTAPPRLIAFTGTPAAAAFSFAGSSIFVVDTATNQILRVQNPDGEPVFTQLLISAIYTKEPAGVVLSIDDSRLFLADKSTAAVRAFDTATGALVSELPLDTAPASLSQFSPGRFQIHAATANQPFFFLDTTEPVRISFVPRQD